jgi:poly-beta-1,6-N-acetyl-D-glucosamine synthase
MVCGPVTFRNARTPFQAWQSLEYTGLSAVGASSLGLQKPNMCSGANLAFRKDVFEQVNGYGSFVSMASGDDEFLMHKTFAKYPGRVMFIKERNAMVFTHACKNIVEFWHQRLRWASKGRVYENKMATIPAVLTWVSSFALVLVTILWLSGSLFTGEMVLAFWIFKSVPEFLFLLTVTPFYGQQKKPDLVLAIPAVLRIVYNFSRSSRKCR